jgi:hypothetical protein
MRLSLKESRMTLLNAINFDGKSGSHAKVYQSVLI